MKSSKDAKTALHTLLAQKAREHYGPNSAVDNLTKLSQNINLARMAGKLSLLPIQLNYSR